MKVTITSSALYQEVTEYNYVPTPAELHFWYSGTNAGVDRANPYAKRYGMSVTKRRYRLVGGQND